MFSPANFDDPVDESADPGETVHVGIDGCTRFAVRPQGVKVGREGGHQWRDDSTEVWIEKWWKREVVI